MIFTMNTQDLLEGLNTVTRALSPRPAKQILEGVLLDAGENRITLTCSDGALSIEYTNIADVQEEGQAVLPGRLFTELIRKLPQGSVTVNVSDGHLANIRCGKNSRPSPVTNWWKAALSTAKVIRMCSTANRVSATPRVTSDGNPS